MEGKQLPFKGNLVLYFNGRLPVAGTTRPPAVSQAPLGPHCVGRQALGYQALGR